MRAVPSPPQKRRADYYLSGTHLSNFNDSDLAIANAWLDTEVPFSPPPPLELFIMKF